MSNTKLRSATFSIHNLVNQMNIASFASRADMRIMLVRCVKDLHELGFKIGHVKGIKERHVYALVAHWKNQNKNPATIKNYMSKLRKMSHTLGNPHMIRSGNDAYHISERSYIPTYNKAITEIDLAKCSDPYIRLALEGQALFGFRREESLKFNVSEANKGSHLEIAPSWTKGGVGRVIAVRSEEQRTWLEKVSQLVNPGCSLIPPNKSYKEQVNHYKTVTSQMGLSNLHGLRHAYAQKRYHELTRYFDEQGKGLVSPIAGGKSYKELSTVEREWDRKARHIIVRELGHSRLNITKIYLG